LEGSWTREVQVPEQVGLNTLGRPAKFPQIVMSKIIVCGPKNLLKSHELAGYTTDGSGHELGLGFAVGKSLGIADR